MNYFVDENSLAIPERNIYTATEITTLIPLFGSVVFQNFFSTNAWTKGFLPNNYMRISKAKNIKPSLLKRVSETILNIGYGNRVDNILMNITAERWNHKTIKRKIDQKGVLMSMSVSKGFAKPNPSGFQKKVVSAYIDRERELNLLLQDKIKINPLH